MRTPVQYFRSHFHWKAACALALAAATLIGVDAGAAGGQQPSPAVVTSVYPVAHPRGLMVTSGGWAYCEQVRALARNTGYTLLCGRYVKDGYLGPGLRAQRHLDWGNPTYLAQFAVDIQKQHARVGGTLILIGVSYSGFGVATLASHHPEIRPDRLIVIDSFLDLVARRHALPPTHETAKEIDLETGGSTAALRARSVSVPGLVRLVRDGTQLTVIWSVAADEQQYFRGATCDASADAATLALLASALHRSVPAWVTMSRHGHDLWDAGRRIILGHYPGRRVIFQPDGQIPPRSTCASS